MKKLIAVTVLLLLITTTAFAANTAEVYAETVTATTDKAILIPVKIKNNTGIMGFKITVNYDKSVLTSPKVIKGSITKNGMMNDSIGVSPKGTIDVVWSGTQNEIGDGTLFVLSFTALKSEDTQIKLSYSQPDTFNEEWEDVELKCSDITIKFADEGSANNVSETEHEYEHPPKVESTQIDKNQPDSEEIKNAVDIVLGETDKGHIDEISEEEKADFVDRTNEILESLAGKPEKQFESVDEIKNAYNDVVAKEFVDDAKKAVNSDKIESAINDSLESVGAESVDKIPADKKAEFAQKVESNIVQYAPDVDTISDKLTADEVVEVIQQLQDENEVAATEGIKLPDPPKNNTATIIILIAAVIFSAVIITVTVVYIKRKKKRRHNK